MKTWSSLQAAYKAAQAAYKHVRGAEIKYGPGGRAFMSAGEKKQLDRYERAMDKASDRIMAWLDKHSPLDWTRGVPVNWICTNLTEEDALALVPAVNPPPAYGYLHPQIPSPRGMIIVGYAYPSSERGGKAGGHYTAVEYKWAEGTRVDCYGVLFHASEDIAEEYARKARLLHRQYITR